MEEHQEREEMADKRSGMQIRTSLSVRLFLNEPIAASCITPPQNHSSPLENSSSCDTRQPSSSIALHVDLCSFQKPEVLRLVNTSRSLIHPRTPGRHGRHGRHCLVLPGVRAPNYYLTTTKKLLNPTVGTLIHLNSLFTAPLCPRSKSQRV